MLKSFGNKYLVQTRSQQEKKNSDTEIKEIFGVVSEPLDRIESLGPHTNGFAHVQL